MLIFGSSEAAVRALPALFGALGVAAVFAASRALFPSRPRIAWIAGAIACVSPLHVYYSQECRMYTLTPLLGILAFLSIHDFLQSGRTRSLFLHSLSLAAGLYTHNYFLFLLPVGSVIAWVTPGGMGRKRALLCAAGAAGAALIVYAPWIPVVLRQSRSGVDAWIPEIWRKTPPAAALFRSLEVMGIGGAYPLYLRQLAAPRETIPLGPVWPLLRFAGFILAVGLPLKGFLAARRNPEERTAGIRLGVFLALALLLPILVSFIIKPVYLVGRYEIVAFMAFAMLAGGGIDALLRSAETRSRRAGWTASALWAAGAALCLAASFIAEVPEDEKDAAAWLRARASSGDLVVYSALTGAVPEYYFGLWNVPGRRISYPPDVDDHFGWCDEEKSIGNEAESVRLAGLIAGDARETVPRDGHAYVVVTRSTRNEINQWILDAFTDRFGKPTSYLGPMTFVFAFGPPP
jgi:hypothetical protein